MYTSLNIDAAAEHIKTIVDNIRCAVCDKTDGTRMRYACGHTSCEDCVVAADCSVCLTPPLSASRGPVADKPFTQRAKNAVNLLNVFQNEFHIDVYKRQRISEQLKVEKEVFPDCIQAPSKYYNKRKSLKNTESNKENRLSQLPGEEVSISDQKMEQTSGNVERWLKKYVRKPFADLNSNNEILRRDSIAIKKQQNVVVTENATINKSTKKRSHFKHLSVVKNQTLKKKEYHKKPRVENSLSVKSDLSRYFYTGHNTEATDKDESGICMDEEDVIVIDDSQSARVDKDEIACLAVQEAEKKKQDDSASIIASKSSALKCVQANIEKVVEAKPEFVSEVPFYLRSYLSEQCIDCNGINIDKSDACVLEPTKDVSITIENKSFTAVIKVTSIEHTQSKINSKQSVEVQTDINNTQYGFFNDENYLDVNLANDKELVKQMSIEKACKPQSEDLFNYDGKMHDHNMENNQFRSANKTQNVIIEESDSDSDLAASVSFEVIADIHRSCEEIDYGILGDVENLGEHSKRPRRAARGFTPTSTDSSEKENYNPNRQKKAPSSKKKPMKK